MNEEFLIDFFLSFQGIDCCSTSVISFHYITYNQMYIFDFLLYHVKLASSRDKLPRKLDIEEIKSRLRASDSLTSTTTIKAVNDEVIEIEDYPTRL